MRPSLHSGKTFRVAHQWTAARAAARSSSLIWTTVGPMGCACSRCCCAGAGPST